ncbi:MAG TPA: S46 family peptidase [Bacteroidia bacterium]|nr:S46 family peptidase [Bacteroidia bacterium]
MKLLTQRHSFLLILLLVNILSARAGEGMWMVQSASSTIGNQLRKAGMILSPDSIYQEHASSLKDAVVQFGSNCTGEVVSSQGLVLTNHHCGYSQIQALSTLERNYLDSGFWARSLEAELPCPGLTVTFIREVRNVTMQVLEAIGDTMSEEDREKAVRAVSDSLIEGVNAETGLTSYVRSAYQGNAYYLYVTEVFRDIRLVGTPPESIGNFGSETDNWVWPRHTGDFAVFRIYAGKDNQPAPFAADNVPYRPKRWFTIQTNGVQEGDFTMVVGFPGKTNAYLPYSALRTVYDQTNPNRIALRQARLSAWDAAMSANDTVRLQYAAKNRTLANAYKKWKGELIGMRRNETLSRVQREERDFRQWLAGNKHLPASYRQCLDELNLAYAELRPLSHASDYYTEGLFGIELMNTSLSFQPLLKAVEADSSVDAQQRLANRQVKNLEAFYRNYHAPLDNLVARRLLATTFQALPDHLRAPAFGDGGWINERGVDSLYQHSILTHPDSLFTLLKNWTPAFGAMLSTDPAISFARSVSSFQAEKIDRPTTLIQRRINQWQRTYMAALMTRAGSHPIFPDANSTLRITFGSVQAIQPRDGISYHWQTHLQGVLEKAATGEEDYRIPQRLRSIARGEEQLPVAFLASNHTTGGNSGSPVLNARGELVGINFDRVWEGVMSDYDFAPDFSRNISCDIRYILFVISKYGEAERLIREMDIRTGNPPAKKR